MPYINVYVSEVLNNAIEKAANTGGREWSRAKWLRKLAQAALVKDAPMALLRVMKKNGKKE